MKDIPIINLDTVEDERNFGFRIATNRQILVHEDLVVNPFEPHRIRFYAILLILEGEGLHYIDFKAYPYQQGSMVFISKEQVHAFEYNDDRKAFFVLFSEDFLEKGGWSAQSNLLQQLSLYNYHLYPPTIQLDQNQMAAFTQLAERMTLEYNSPMDDFTVDIIHSALFMFLSMAERIRKQNSEITAIPKYQEEFTRFQKLLQKEVLNSRKVQDYADQLLVSTKKLNRITQAMLGISAKAYIDEVLIIEIKRLLMNTSSSISEIAYLSGFNEVTNFVKFFKKHTKLNPSAFRNQIQTIIRQRSPKSK